MHIVALLIESNTATAATQRNKRQLLYFSRMAQQRVFGKEIAEGSSQPRKKRHFRLTRLMLSRVVRVPRNDLAETSSSSCLVICRRVS